MSLGGIGLVRMKTPILNCVDGSRMACLCTRWWQDTTVEGLKGQISTLDQTAQSLSLELTAIRQNGADKVKTTQGYTFDDKGLHISRSDSDMANTLDHTGMYVRRGKEVMLQANNQGVVATDVTVRNYLSIGHARFEEYSNGSDFARTACFFV